MKELEERSNLDYKGLQMGSLSFKFNLMRYSWQLILKDSKTECKLLKQKLLDQLWEPKMVLQ